MVRLEEGRENFHSPAGEEEALGSILVGVEEHRNPDSIVLEVAVPSCPEVVAVDCNSLDSSVVEVLGCSLADRKVAVEEDNRLAVGTASLDIY